VNRHVDAVKWTPAGYTLPVFAAVNPEAIRTGAVERATVVIAGGGLTGLTLAADLASRGIKAIVLDDDDTIGVRGAASRGMVWSQKTLEVMDRLGIADRMIGKGVIWSVGRTLTGNDVVYQFDRGEQNLSRQPAFVNLQQFYLEWYLVERIAELGGVDLRWKNKVSGIRQSEHKVTLEVTADEGSYVIEADWVVDATGANSAIRTLMQLNTNPARHVDRWCICDVRCVELNVPERWTWVEAPFNGGRAVWQHMMADNVWRLDYQLDPESEPADAANPETSMERVRSHLGPAVSFELVWTGPWEYRTQVLDRFRVGRLLFAGDAAHVMSPFGARGGNSGIQDADNLGWKLGLVIEGKAKAGLLDTYDEERRAAAIENIKVTAQTSRFLAPQSPFERRLRKALLTLAQHHPFAQAMVNTGRLSVPNRYASSAVILDGGGAALPNVTLHDHTGKAVGLSELMRNMRLAGLALYIPRAGHDPARAAITGIGGEGLPYVARTLDVGVGAERCAFQDRGARLAELTGAVPGDAILVRPDLYCAAVLRTPSAAGVERALSTVMGFPS
jgi:3-(3-hydroxy-phenyl)propionate hydroxylase